MSEITTKLNELQNHGVEMEIITTALSDAKFFKELGKEYLSTHFKTVENAEVTLERLNNCVSQSEIDDVVKSVGNGWATALANGINKKIQSGETTESRADLQAKYPARMVRYALRGVADRETTLKGVVEDVAKKALAEAPDVETALALFDL